MKCGRTVEKIRFGHKLIITEILIMGTWEFMVLFFLLQIEVWKFCNNFEKDKECNEKF